MRRLLLVPSNTRIPFMRWRWITFGISMGLIALSVVLMAVRGMNFGIDFQGGTLIEIGTSQPADIGAIRGVLGQTGVGEVQIQEFGGPNQVLIRIGEQTGDERAQQAVLERVRAALAGILGEGVEYRRIEVVGPKVSGDLIKGSVIAMVLAVGAMLIYIWFRFEWQYGIGAVFALIHDVMLTLGLFAALQLEFNLTTVAAVLLIVGYSMNDTVVVYDRIRENLRKYKRMPLIELIDLSTNETLSRTIMTGVTTLLALLSLSLFGGPVIRDFTLAMIFGIIVGTYSSIFIGSTTLLWSGLSRREPEAAGSGARAG